MPAVSCVAVLSHLKKKGVGSNRLFQVDTITGEDISSLETWFEAGADKRSGLCVFSAALQKTSCRDDRKTGVGHYFTHDLLKYNFKQKSTNESEEQLNSKLWRNKAAACELRK